MKKFYRIFLSVLFVLNSHFSFSQNWPFGDSELPRAETAILDEANSLFEEGKYEESMEKINQFDADSVYLKKISAFMGGQNEEFPAISEAEFLFEKEKYEESLRVICDFLKDHPKNYRGISVYACALAQLDPSKAETECNKILYYFPLNAEFLTIRGKSYQIRGLSNEAIRDFSAALFTDKSYSLYNIRGVAYGNSRKYAEALEDFSESIRLNPKTSNQAFAERGMVYRELKDFDKAEADFKVYLNGGGKKDIAYRNLAIIKIERNDIKPALDYSERLVKLAPQSAESYYVRGLVYFHKGDYKKSLKDCDKAIKISPSHSLAHTLRAEVYNKIGKKEKALADSEEAIKNALNQIEIRDAYKIRSLIYLSANQKNSALADLEKVLEFSATKTERAEIQALIQKVK